jgi:pilus assembly protein CpaB
MDRASPAARWARRNRRGLAALLAAASVLALGLALRPTPIRTATVIVASADLPVGHRLTAADLQRAHVAAEMVAPHAATDAAEIQGRILAAPVARGEPITALRLVDAAPGGWATAPGAMPMPVRFADAQAAALLSPGMRLDLIAPPAMGDGLVAGGGSSPARLVAEGVLVLAIAPASADDQDLFLASAGTGTVGPVVVVEATRSQALAIAGASAGAGLMFTLRTGSP